jgi:OB-fold nucleic acid binding domain-containing protein (fragment)
MKKITIQLLAVAGAMALFASEARAQATVQLNSHETIQLIYGQKDSVKATISAPGETLSWSTNPALAGLVAKSAADSTWGVITAPTAGPNYDGWVVINYGAAKDSVKLVISAPVTSVTLGAPLDTTMGIGTTKTLTATVFPNTPPNNASQEVLYSSSNSAVAEVQTVGLQGIITAKAVGTARITVSAGKGAGMKTDTILVKVDNPITGLNFAITTDTIPMQINSELDVQAVATPANADNINTLQWSIVPIAPATPGLVTIASNSGLTVKLQSAATPGIARLTVTSTNGVTANRVIKVLDPIHVTAMTIDKDTVSLPVGKKDTLTARILPAEALNKKVTWTSTNPSFAAVERLTDTTAVVTGKTVGVAMIVGETEDGNFKDTCYIYVRNAVELKAIKLDKQKIRLKLNTTDTLAVAFSPANASDQRVKFLSADTSIATVDANGVIKGLKTGTVYVSVTSLEGGFKDSCEVTVYDPNPNVETAAGVNIWSAENGLRVQSDKARTLAVYSISGALYRKETVVGDRFIALPSGLYIVTLGEVSRKVAIP